MIYICENPTIKSIILCIDFKIINIYKCIGNKAKSTELGKEWGFLKRQDLEWEGGRETKQLVLFRSLEAICGPGKVPGL